MYDPTINPMIDSREAFTAEDEAAYYADAELDGFFDRDFEDDGQPSEYDEWQDVYGGDDWDHGQYDEAF